MDRYIGLDVHATSCTMVVVSESGKEVLKTVVETNAAALIEALKQVPGKRHLLMEEGTQSAWLHEVLPPHVAELVVMGLGGNGRVTGNKSDAVPGGFDPDPGGRITQDAPPSWTWRRKPSTLQGTCQTVRCSAVKVFHSIPVFPMIGQDA